MRDIFDGKQRNKERRDTETGKELRAKGAAFCIMHFCAKVRLVFLKIYSGEALALRTDNG